MRKIKGLSFLVILGALTVVFFLSSTSFMQGQDSGDTWAVRIPTQDEATNNGLMFYGKEGTDGTFLYENNGTTIEVKVYKNSMSGPWNRYYDFVYNLDFKLTNENVGTGVPPTNYVGFQNVPNLYEVTYPDDDKSCCQFPPTPYVSSGGDCGGAGCMAEFLDNIHPYSDGTPEHDYEYFQSQIQVFDKDIESMSPGEVYTFGTASDPGDPGDLFGMTARYREGCYEESAFHDVEFYRSINYWRAKDKGNALNIVIKRLSSYDIDCEGVWRILVYPGDYPDDYYAGDEAYLRVKERYCAVERNKSTWYYPMQAKGNFDFYIDFIKNPGASTEPDPDPEPPVAPSNLDAIASSCSQIDLIWTDNSNNENGFEIERSGTVIGTVGSNVTSYSDDTGLSENTSYSYTVRAFNDAGYSDYSNTASATTPECVAEPPAAPTGLTAKQPGKAPKVQLEWNDNSTNEDGFRIYRDDIGLVATVGANTTSYEDNNFTSGETYTYQVCAYNASGESCSGTVSVTTK